MRPAPSTFLPVLAVALSGSALAQGADECVNAIDLGVGDTSFFFDTNNCSDTGVAATNSGESDCFLSADVWVKYTASASGVATFSTCNNADYDTEIGVYEGSDCSTFVNLGCNDDFSGCGLTSEITVPVTGGETYHVQVGYFSSFTSVFGTGTITITETPFGGGADECVNAIDIGVGPNTFDFDTSNCSDTGLPATTSAESACLLSDDIWIKYEAGITGMATFDTCADNSFDSEIGVYEGADCSTFVNLDCNDDFCGLQSSVTVPVTAGETYHIQVGFWNSASSGSGTGTITITEMPSGVPSNNECTTPAAIFAGMNMIDSTGATSSGFDGGGSPCGTGINQDVFFVFDVPSSGDWQFDTFGTSYDTILAVHAGSDCSATCLGSNDDAVGLQSQVDVMGLNTGDLVLIQFGAFSGGVGPAMLNITQTSNPCDTPDGFEENDDCAGAAPIADGMFAGLNVETDDNDYFAVTLADGATIDASIFFVDAAGDLDLYLWDPMVACDTNVVGTGFGSGALAIGFSASDDETLSYTNMTGATQFLILEVDVFLTGVCNTYDLEVMGTGDGTIGTSFCAVEANSTGVAAKLEGSGSASLANNDLVLTLSQAPAASFSVVIASLQRDFVPMSGGGMGNLCLGGDIGRGVGGQIYSTGGMGTFDAPVDWQAVPQPLGPVVAAIGETWFFQAWFRDFVGAATSNLSNGLGVTVE
ncbi:MAG: hypothetical protein AAGA20_14705 [Planctomycetota bacterium]